MFGIRIEDIHGVGIYRSDYSYYLPPDIIQAIDELGERTPMPTPGPISQFNQEGPDFHKHFVRDQSGQWVAVQEDLIFIWHLDFFKDNFRLNKYVINTLRAAEFRIKIVHVKKALASSEYQMLAQKKKVKISTIVTEPYDFYQWV